MYTKSLSRLGKPNTFKNTVFKIQYYLKDKYRFKLSFEIHIFFIIFAKLQNIFKMKKKKIIKQKIHFEQDRGGTYPHIYLIPFLFNVNTATEYMRLLDEVQ